MALYLLVYLKRCKTDCQGKSPLFLRVSIDGKRAEIALRRSIDPKLWDNRRQCVIGRNEFAKSINAQIEAFKLKLQNHYIGLVNNGDEVTANSLRAAFLGISAKGKTLIELFDYHNLKLKEQIGKGYAKATYKRYITCLGLLKKFLASKYKERRVDICE